jgi:K+-sensing histidine kinase KdpD
VSKSPSPLSRLRLTDARAAFVTLAFDAGLVLVTVAAKYSLLQLTDANAGFTIYVPAIAIAAWYRGLLGGVLATVLGALFDTIVFLPALAVVLVDLRDQQLRLIVYLVGGGAVSYITHRLRNERDNAREQADERRRALQDAAMAREELGRILDADRRANELRDEFNSIISHELRTPITAIYGGAKLLASRDRSLDDAARTEIIEDLEAESDRLYRLVEDLLVLAKSERGTIDQTTEPVLLPHLTARVVRSEHGRWPSARFALTAPKVVSPVRGEETYVEQVLRNLLNNAAKYSEDGKTINIIIDEGAEGVRVRVLDTGPGIDESEAARLFDLYYRSPTTAAKASGAGIGLYVCKVLVEAMGGRVWACPRPEGGAEFGFVLTRSEDDEE